jgi:hypothetical protein
MWWIVTLLKSTKQALSFVFRRTSQQNFCIDSQSGCSNLLNLHFKSRVIIPIIFENIFSAHMLIFYFFKITHSLIRILRATVELFNSIT